MLGPAPRCCCASWWPPHPLLLTAVILEEYSGLITEHSVLQLSLVLISFQRQKCSSLHGPCPAWLALSLWALCVGAGDSEAAACGGERPRSRLRSSPLFVLCGPGGLDLSVCCVASLKSDLQRGKMPKDANRQNSRKADCLQRDEPSARERRSTESPSGIFNSCPG